MTSDTVPAEVGQSALLDDPAFWPLMPDERLEWVGRPAARDGAERATLRADLLKTFLFALALSAVGVAFYAGWWFYEDWRLSGDVEPFEKTFVLAFTVIAVLFSAIALLVVFLEWRSRQRRLLLTRYAVTDRRVIAALPSSGPFVFQCHSRHLCRAGTAAGGWRTILLNGEVTPGADLVMERMADAAPLDRLFAASGARA